jgi:transcription elongation factor Elf1
MPYGYPKKKTYIDKFYCPKCGKLNSIKRKIKDKGEIIDSYCKSCYRKIRVQAGRKDLS